MMGMWWWPVLPNSGTSSTSRRCRPATRTLRVMICPTTSGFSEYTLRVLRTSCLSLASKPS